MLPCKKTSLYQARKFDMAVVSHTHTVAVWLQTVSTHCPPPLPPLTTLYHTLLSTLKIFVATLIPLKGQSCAGYGFIVNTYIMASTIFMAQFIAHTLCTCLSMENVRIIRTAQSNTPLSGHARHAGYTLRAGAARLMLCHLFLPVLLAEMRKTIINSKRLMVMAKAMA